MGQADLLQEVFHMQGSAADMYFVQSVRRAIAILRLLSNSGPMTVSEIARAIDAPKTTCFMILYTLEHEGLIDKQPDNRYAISNGIYDLIFGNTYLNILREVGQPIAEQLSEATGMTVHIAVRDGIETVYIVKAEGPGFVQFNTHVGQRHLLHLTSVGKSILMGMSDEQILTIIPRDRYEPKTKYTITSPEQLLSQIQEFRKKGYAIEDEEGEYGICCIGAPIVDSRGRTVGAFSVTELKSKLTQDTFDKIGSMLIEAAAKMASRLEMSRFEINLKQP